MTTVVWTLLFICLSALPAEIYPDEVAHGKNISAHQDNESTEVFQPDLGVIPSITELVLLQPSVPDSEPETQERLTPYTHPPVVEDGVPSAGGKAVAKSEGDSDEQALESQQNFLEGSERDCDKDLPAEEMHRISNAMLKFTGDILREMELDGSKDNNLFFSPLSIILALAQLTLGAANQTEKHLIEALKMESVPCLHQALGNVYQHLDKAVLSLATRLYLRKGFEVKQMFLEDSERFYKAKPVTLSGNNEADVVAINNWVKEATKGQIPSILSELPASTVMVLLNAVHFKGFWRDKFDPSLTERSMFHLDEEFGVSVEMMKAQKYYLSWFMLDSPDVQVARFPFKGNTSFVAILPNQFERNFSRLLSDLTWADFRSHFPKERPTLVKMPKLHLQYHLELNRALTRLGLGELFSSPDFRRIADVPLFVSSIQHQSALDLAEDGVEASAVTSVVMSRSISTFSLNRPFVFLIIEDTTGVPLFIGSIQNPDPSAPKQRKEQQDLPDEKLGAYNSLPK